MLLASGVNLAQPLKAPLADIGAGAQGRLADVLGRLKAQAATSNKVSRRPMGSYQDFALNQAGTMAGRGINDALYASLGGTSYKDLRDQQQFERQMALAKEIGDKMSPSTLEEIFGGLSQGVDLAAKGKGIKDALGQTGGGGSPSYGSSLNLTSSGNPFKPTYPTDPVYDWKSNWGGSY